MCGIAGFVSADPSGKPDIVAVERMTDSMRLRGPDARGLWEAPGAAFGHRRLAILDLDARANQPMSSGDGRYTIVFNGEIYNFRELRRFLEADGVEFRTCSDTEVLLVLFARNGERMLPMLRGMFAFAIWDSVTSELFMARDPYGIKPLYYARTPSGLLFASQVKALLASGCVPQQREVAGLAGFYLSGSVPEPWTMFRDVFALPAGFWLRASPRMKDKIVNWHDIRRHWRGPAGMTSFADLEARVREALSGSVGAHLVSDVPISLFLSGGVDSAALAGLAAGIGAKVECVTIGFEEFVGTQDDEVPAAAEVAAYYGLVHHVRRVTRSEFEADISSIMSAMDQPSVDGVNTWFASKAAAERGFKVVLSGAGGDELLCGYSSFRNIPRVATIGRAISIIPGANVVLGAACAQIARRRSQPKYAAVPEYMNSLEGAYFLSRALFLPNELPLLMGRSAAQEGLSRLGGSPPGLAVAGARDGASAVGLLESTNYLRNQLLRDGDWASMGHSLELRLPFVDSVLLGALGEYVSAFAGGSGKAMLARSPVNPMPGAGIKRAKTGFSVPMAKWLAESSKTRAWTDMPMLASPGTPWARRWARTIIMETVGC